MRGTKSAMANSIEHDQHQTDPNSSPEYHKRQGTIVPNIMAQRLTVIHIGRRNSTSDPTGSIQYSEKKTISKPG